METFRLSSKLREKEREYLIQTSNDLSARSVSTTVYVDGVQTDTFICPHPGDMSKEQLLSLVKKTHGDRKKELEGLLTAYQCAGELSDPDSMYRLAEALHNKKLFHEAADILQGVVSLNPDHHRALDQLGQTLLASGQSERAVEAASRAAEMRPEYADYRNNLGEAYLAAGSALEAVAEFEVAIGINMYYGDAYFNLGLAHVLVASRSTDRERTLQAVTRVQEYLQKASLVYPEYRSHGNYQEALLALEGRDFGRAISLLKAISEARKELKRQQYVSLNRRLLTQPEAWTEETISEQIRSLHQELEKHPNYQDLQRELARCYFEKAAVIWNQGMQICRSMLEADPDHTTMPEVLEKADAVRGAMAVTIEETTKKG